LIAAFFVIRAFDHIFVASREIEVIGEVIDRL